MLHTPVYELSDRMSVLEFSKWITFLNERASHEPGKKNLVNASPDEMLRALTGG